MESVDVLVGTVENVLAAVDNILTTVGVVMEVKLGDVLSITVDSVRSGILDVVEPTDDSFEEVWLDDVEIYTEDASDVDVPSFSVVEPEVPVVKSCVIENVVCVDTFELKVGAGDSVVITVEVPKLVEPLSEGDEAVGENNNVDSLVVKNILFIVVGDVCRVLSAGDVAVDENNNVDSLVVNKLLFIVVGDVCSVLSEGDEAVDENNNVDSLVVNKLLFIVVVDVCRVLEIDLLTPSLVIVELGGEFFVEDWLIVLVDICLVVRCVEVSVVPLFPVVFGCVVFVVVVSGSIDLFVGLNPGKVTSGTASVDASTCVMYPWVVVTEYMK